MWWAREATKPSHRSTNQQLSRPYHPLTANKMIIACHKASQNPHPSSRPNSTICRAYCWRRRTRWQHPLNCSTHAPSRTSWSTNWRRPWSIGSFWTSSAATLKPSNWPRKSLWRQTSSRKPSSSKNCLRAKRLPSPRTKRWGKTMVKTRHLHQQRKASQESPSQGSVHPSRKKRYWSCVKMLKII